MKTSQGARDVNCDFRPRRSGSGQPQRAPRGASFQRGKTEPLLRAPFSAKSGTKRTNFDPAQSTPTEIRRMPAAT